MDNRNLMTVKTFVAFYLSQLSKFDLMNRNFLDIAFNKMDNQFSKTILDNFQPTKLDNNKLILEKSIKDFFGQQKAIYIGLKIIDIQKKK